MPEGQERGHPLVPVVFASQSTSISDPFWRCQWTSERVTTHVTGPGDSEGVVDPSSMAGP